MICYENAKLLEAEELKTIINDPCMNPTVERLMFIETKPKAEGEVSKIFPCYLLAWGVGHPPEGVDDAHQLQVPQLQFLACIVQSMNGQFALLNGITILAEDLNVTKRIWDRPPTKGLREDTPWVAVEAGVQ